MTQTATQARRAVNLDGVEHECGGHFRLVDETRDVTIGQSRVPVRQEFFRCDVCNEERQTLDQLGAARRAAAVELRARQGLLSGGEIRRIREERLQITQAKLEQALGLGEKTVVRWETERVLQPKATDDLLRLLDRDPSALAFLARHHGVELEVEADPDQQGEEQSADPSTCSLPIPRSYLIEIRNAAAHQGVQPSTYVTWLLAERVTALRALDMLERHAVGEELARHVDEGWAWQRLSREWPAYSPAALPSTPAPISAPVEEASFSYRPAVKKRYAQSA